MEVRIADGLEKLAQAILKDSGKAGSKITLDQTLGLFSGQDTDRITFTLKNYKMPYGVATQIFNTDIIGNQKEEDVPKNPFQSEKVPNEEALEDLINELEEIPQEKPNQKEIHTSYASKVEDAAKKEEDNNDEDKGVVDHRTIAINVAEIDEDDESHIFSNDD